MQVFTKIIYSEYEWNKKKYLNVFFQTWYPFYYFYHIPKTRLEKYMHAHKKRIVNFMNNAHKKLKCIKGLLILWITCCCLFQKIYQTRKKCESYHTSQLTEHHNNQRPIPGWTPILETVYSRTQSQPLARKLITRITNYHRRSKKKTNVNVILILQILKLFATRLYIKKL